jgi:hypothetical protein
MDCRECVRNSAVSLSRILETPTGQVARQLFQILYPEPACLPMSAAFVQYVQDGARRTRRQPLYQAAVA